MKAAAEAKRKIVDNHGNGTMKRSIKEAESEINALLAKRSAEGHSPFVQHVGFVLCEDFATVMIYVDVVDEQDAIAIYFDLLDDMPFDPHLFRRQIRFATVH